MCVMALSDNQLQQATAHLEHAVGVQLNNIILPYSPLCNDSLYFKSAIQDSLAARHGLLLEVDAAADKMLQASTWPSSF